MHLKACDRVPTVMENPGKTWKKLLSWKSLGMWKFPKKSWKSHGIACSHGYSSFLVCDCRACRETIITISETTWEWESWKEANQSWKSHGILFSGFCGYPDVILGALPIGKSALWNILWNIKYFIRAGPIQPRCDERGGACLRQECSHEGVRPPGLDERLRCPGNTLWLWWTDARPGVTHGMDGSSWLDWVGRHKVGHNKVMQRLQCSWLHHELL